ncbi:MAG: DUF4271 domain-containing protein [Bacteroidales bacterium]|nr:DUF4271 domain-containing protein [Bacteroidales bacterium]
MTLVPSHLSTNIVLELLVLAFLLVNAMAVLAPGLMRGLVGQVFETRSARTFEKPESKYYTLRILMMLQLFIFAGLHVFLLLSTNPAEQLQYPTEESWWLLGVCLLIPVGWVFVQQLLFNWWGYLFSSHEGIQILNRVYQAVHILFSPLTLLCFLFEMIGLIEVETSTVLLSLTFIMIQILFIFSGIKIFWGGLSTLFFLFLYLCTLEIAPMVMIFQLLTR